jgi:acetyltransferase
MYAHYLTPMFKPKSIAVFGASSRAQSVGGVTFGNILQGGFEGPVYAINPKHVRVRGKKAYRSIETLDKPVDLAVIATPAQTVPGIVEDCGKYGVRSAIILSAGFREVGDAGRRLEDQALARARKYGLRFIGPNCLGMIRPDIGLNATFSKGAAGRGRLALVSQSGALCTAILDWAAASDVGFSSVISTGISADVGFGEILDFLVSDPETDGILLYVEGINNTRAFMSGLRAASRAKPVIVMKSGRHEGGSRAAVSHSGALVGSDDVFDAAIARAGVVRVISFSEFFAAARMLASGLRVSGDRLAIVTNGGGPAVMAMDRLEDHGLKGADLSDESLQALDAELPATWSRGNPVDVIGDATPARYGSAVRICLKDSGVDAVLAILTPQAMTEPEAVAAEIVSLVSEHPKPMLACWMGEQEVEAARSLFRQHGVPSYKTPEAAVEAFHVLASHHRHQQLLLQAPEPLAKDASPDIEGARMIIESALADDRRILNEIEAKALLHAFRIPIAKSVRARDDKEALVVAEQIGFPVALKVNSPDVSHKTDVGGVRLNIGDARALRSAYKDMMADVAARAPEARMDGVTVEEMCVRPNGRELMVGVVSDPAFGPVITFGTGGTTVEVFADRSVALPPLNHYLVETMIAQTRAMKLLGPFRNFPPADLTALEDVLLRVSEMVCNLPAVAEMDINPLVIDEHGVVAVDARVVLRRRPPAEERYAHMAIHPYPSELVERFQPSDGPELTIRPIRPEDAAIEERFVRELSRQSRYFRFMYNLKELTPAMLSRFTQLDYDREMALIAVVPEGGEEKEIAVARYVINPDRASCEFAVVVGDEWQRKGVATRLLTSLIRSAESKRITRFEGSILSENHKMLSFLKRMGFDIRRDPDDPQIELAVKYL